jgi:hypothetical protein
MDIGKPKKYTLLSSIKLVDDGNRNLCLSFELTTSIYSLVNESVSTLKRNMKL